MQHREPILEYYCWPWKTRALKREIYGDRQVDRKRGADIDQERGTGEQDHPPHFSMDVNNNGPACVAGRTLKSNHHSLISLRISMSSLLLSCYGILMTRGVKRKHTTGHWCWRRRRVNTVGHCTQELDRLNLAIATEQDKRIPRRRRRPGWGPALAVREREMPRTIGHTI